MAIFQNNLVDKELFPLLVDAVSAVLLSANGSKGLKPKEVEDSLANTVLGKRLHSGLLDEVCHLLVGNEHLLKSGRPVSFWSLQRTHEWVPVQVLDVHRVRVGRGGGARLLLKVMAGSACPMRLFVDWSFKRCRMLASTVGFHVRPPRRGTPFFYHAPEQFTQLRFLVLLDPEISDLIEPRFSKVDITPSCLQWNKKVFHRRLRIDFACPLGLPDVFECHHCAVGYAAENEVRCAASCHRMTWRSGHCRACGLADAKFDDMQSKTLCLFCFYQKAKLG